MQLGCVVFLEKTYTAIVQCIHKMNLLAIVRIYSNRPAAYILQADLVAHSLSDIK